MSTTTFPTRSDAVSTATAGKDYLIHVNKGASDLEPDWLLVGGQRSGNLNRKADELDASHKTSGGWACHLPGLRNWSIDLESVVLLNDEGAHYLEAAFNAGHQVHLKFEYPDKSYYTGWGSITEFSLKTQHDDVATISGTISGTMTWRPFPAPSPGTARCPNCSGMKRNLVVRPAAQNLMVRRVVRKPAVKLPARKAKKTPEAVMMTPVR